MHIPENYLSPSTCGVFTVAMVPVWVHATKKVKTELPKEKLPLLGVGAAFSFIAMMFNVPMVGGTTGHATGAALLAILLGPDAACLCMSAALLLQAVLFGDGGILSFGANCFNMAFVIPYLSYFIYTSLTKENCTNSKKVLNGAIASYIGLNVAALLAAIEFGVQPYLFKDALGNPLYCPYGLNLSIPSMMLGHLAVFGFVEAIFTSGVLSYIFKTQPELMNQAKPSSSKHTLYPLLLVLILFVPVGLLASGTAWGEWGNEELESMLGYVPQGILNGFSLESLLPDYSVTGLSSTLGYYLSAILGVGILILVFKLCFNKQKKKAI